MVGKYEPLRRYLENVEGDSWDARFSDLEGILGFELPGSAHRYSAWWANESHGSHSHSRSWQDAGWATSEVNLEGRQVRFLRKRSQRGGSPAKRQGPSTPSASNQALWVRAGELTGIRDHDELIEAALTALIRRESGKGLIALGGTMPDFAIPPRERPNL
jgi:hypothetical protein